MRFRKDINGLRAYAVIAVVLFHFNSAWMPGGFAGVDVFFVISGFLMTGIIFRGLEDNKFSVLNFYVARANRIIPALAALCLVLLFLGWFYLSPLEYRALAKHAASSIAFLSNIIYWMETGYFDPASHEKWLLHTWSLSVEWQFYIIYPIVLLTLKRVFSLKTLKLFIVAGTVIGFVFCVYSTYKWPTAAYYLFPMRAWQMMLGGIAFIYPFYLKDGKSKILELFGLALIIVSYILISGSDPWPGYLSLFPVLGAFLVIQAQRNDSLLTGNIVFQKIGAWSYSIYLWHWPFVVAIYTFSLPNQYIYIGMGMSVVLGFLSYKYIERIKFPRNFPNLKSYLKCKPIYIAIFVGILGSMLYLNYDSLTTYRLSSEQLDIIEQQNKNPREEVCGNVLNGVSPKCTYGEGPVKAIVVGDSHAQAQIVAISQIATKHGGSVLDLGLMGCNTILGAYNLDKNGLNPDYNCGKLVKNALNIASTEYPGTPVIIINRNSQHLYGKNEDEDGFAATPNFFVDKEFNERSELYRANLLGHMLDTICEFTEKNPVYLVRPIPELVQNVPLTMFKSETIKGAPERVKLPFEDYQVRQATAYNLQDRAADKCGAHILDPIPLLCDSKFCYGDKNNIPLYYDDDHLSLYGAEFISPIYEEVFDN